MQKISLPLGHLLLFILLFLQSCSHGHKVVQQNSDKKISIIRKDINISTKNKYNIVNKPIITDEKIYLLDNKGRVSSRNLIDGQLNWQIELDKSEQFINANIDYRNQKLIATTGSDRVYFINAENGKITSTKIFQSSPVVANLLLDDISIISSLNNKSYAVLDELSLVWSHEVEENNISTLGSAKTLSYKNMVIALYSSGEIYCLNKYNGKIIWQDDLVNSSSSGIYSYLSDIDIDPIIKDGVVYIVGNSNSVVAFNIENGKRIWQQKTDEKPEDIAILGSKIALITADNLYLINKNNGRIELKKDVISYNKKKKISLQNVSIYKNKILLIAKNRVILVDTSGKLVANIKLRQNIYNKPIIYKNKIYLTTYGWICRT